MLAIVNIGTEDAYEIIDPDSMARFLNSVKNNLQFSDNDPNQWHLKDTDTGAGLLEP